MNLSEFKAWFGGYTEEMEGPPTEKQWKRIKKKIDKIDDTPTTWPIFIDRYIRPYRPYWKDGTFWTSTGGSSLATAAAPQQWLTDINTAFQEAGRIEFQAEREGKAS